MIITSSLQPIQQQSRRQPRVPLAKKRILESKVGFVVTDFRGFGFEAIILPVANFECYAHLDSVESGGGES